MSLAHQTAESAARALAIAAIALLLAPPLARLLAHTHGRRRTLVWALLLAPLLTPALLVSYAYSHLAHQLMATPGAIAALYFAALTLKLVPVATIILHFVPPALSPEAVRCHMLLNGRKNNSLRSTKDTKEHEKGFRFRDLSCLSWTSPTWVKGWWAHWIFQLRAAGRAPWMAGGLVFLFAFIDFELASLWSLKTWTVALFDAQAGGLALGASLRLAALPLAIEVAALALILRTPAFSSAPVSAGKAPGRSARRALLAYLGGAALLACGWPLGRVALQAVAGFRVVAENFVLADDLAASLAFAAAATVGAWLLAVVARTPSSAVVWRVPRPPSDGRGRPADSRGRGVRATLLAAPGLCGALLLSLALLAAFQLPLLHPAYDSPLPLLLALTLLLLPFALPLRWLLDTTRRDPALHLAKLGNCAALLWQLDTRRRWLAAFLLFCWAYFDFTAGSILAPVGLTPVFVRLHNLAHYGQTAVLSAMFLAAFAAPVAVLLLTAPAARWYARR